MRRSRRRRLTPSGETATTIDVHFWLSVLFIIPSVVEESLTFNRGIVRDVSVRAGLAYSLDMTKEAAAATPPAGPQIQPRVQPQAEHPLGPASRYALCKTE